MDLQEIKNGLQMTQKNCPKATVGMAIQELMGLGRFTYRKNDYAIKVGRPVDCKFSIYDICNVIMQIQSLLDDEKIVLTKAIDNYGLESNVEPMRVRGHHLESIELPPIPCHLSNNQTWELLSSEYEIK